ncbi:uncharacterized protein EAF01_008579 [Botrytis porri]|uniref:uncharacterized protein n=1 Tax=Botrytis porri TaxID=87229 RepID=UPI0019005D0A|nr:uncharacterized protein EAF01_008579 [Botrytis porri]KAF7899366.1 hypothetical protein EAF01_008579 [Botrytis porri]
MLSANSTDYDSRNLILSYNIATFIVFISIIIGILSCISNGVAYSTPFSALVATTRNPNSMLCPRDIVWAHYLLTKKWQRRD